MKTLRIEFDDYPDDWVEVRVSPVSVRDLFDVQGAMSGMSDREAYDNLFDKFAQFVVGWSFPEAPDRDGLWSRDLTLLMAVISTWAEGVAEVPLPLLRKSSGGTQSASPEDRNQPSSRKRKR